MKTVNNFPEVTAETLKQTNIAQMAHIARMDKSNWNGGIYFGAVPYLNAMSTMDKITDNYGLDEGTSIVAYFLGNATNWRGDTAKLVKAELNKRLKAAR
jgi:hypothetical protein